MARHSCLEELAEYKGATEGTTAAKEIKKLIHIEAVRKPQRNMAGTSKKKRKGMVDHILVPSFNVTVGETIIFFLLIPPWLWEMGTSKGTYIQRAYLMGRHLLALCWLVFTQRWDKKETWRRISDHKELYRCMLERDKCQLLKSLDSPFSTGPLANVVGR